MLKFLHKFFEPAFLAKKATMKLLFESSLAATWFDVMPIFTIPYLIKLLDEGNSQNILNFSYIILIVYIILWLANLYFRKWDFQAKYAYEITLNGKYRKGFILKNNSEMDKFGTGKIQSIIQKGMNSWADANWQSLYQVPKTVFIFAIGIYITLNLGAWYTLLFLVSTVLSLTAYISFKKKELKYNLKMYEVDNKFVSDSVRMIMSRQEIMFSNKEDKEVENLTDLLQERNKLNTISAKYIFGADVSVGSMGVLLPFLGIIFITFFTNLNSIDKGVIVTFIYFCSRLSFSLYSVSWMIQQFVDKYSDIKKLWDFIDDIPQIKNYEVGKIFKHANGKVVLENVSFSYGIKNTSKPSKDPELEKENEDIKSILENFSMTIKGGEKIALIGKSGSGKTTIAKLISGYMNPTSGKVLIDGQDLSKVSLKSFYKYLGYLTQEPMVFDGSIKENLLYAVGEKVSDEKIMEALQKANCNFISKIPKGIHTQIGEKGIRLSGGERQRLAIAKLFLKDPEIIILDEPTSALDSFSEDLITKSLEELFKGRTTIIIAHRLQTVKKADRILVIENGQITEEGNHESLIAQNGHYAQMLAMQSGF